MWRGICDFQYLVKIYRKIILAIGRGCRFNSHHLLTWYIWASLLPVTLLVISLLQHQSNKVPLVVMHFNKTLELFCIQCRSYCLRSYFDMPLIPIKRLLGLRLQKESTQMSFSYGKTKFVELCAPLMSCFGMLRRMHARLYAVVCYFV